MSWVRGHIEPCWTVTEVSNLDYFTEPFNDSATADHWNQLYGQSFGVGQQADYRSRQLSNIDEIVGKVTDQIGQLDCVSTSFYCMMPGDILPHHRDSYSSYCKYHAVRPEQVTRVIVFINPWHPGFLFEIDGEPIVKYQWGDFVAWNYNTEHMAGNLGCTPRYTLQITGIKK
jgi:hypothetical protein